MEDEPVKSACVWTCVQKKKQTNKQTEKTKQSYVIFTLAQGKH